VKVERLKAITIIVKRNQISCDNKIQEINLIQKEIRTVGYYEEEISNV
jgi:hypothetical protein